MPLFISFRITRACRVLASFLLLASFLATRNHRWLGTRATPMTPNDLFYPLDETWDSQFKLTGSYLLPVDIDVGSENDAVYNAVLLDDVLNLLAGARAKLTVAFVDACRNNPLPPAARSIGRGLAQPKEVPYGQMVVYAAGAG